MSKHQKQNKIEEVDSESDDGDDEIDDDIYEIDEDIYRVNGFGSDNSEDEEEEEEEQYSKKHFKPSNGRRLNTATTNKSLKSNNNNNSESSKLEFKIIPYESLKKLTPTKGILKNKQNVASKKRILWDEENISEHDANKTGNIIDEPKTPFHQYESESEENYESNKYLENRFSQLEKALNTSKEPSEWDSDDNNNNSNNNNGNIKRKKLKSKPKKSAKIAMGSDSDSDEEMDVDKKKNKDKFDKLRKSHYNEFLTIKSLNMDLSDEEDLEVTKSKSTTINNVK